MTATNEVKLSQDQINEALTDLAAVFKKHNITIYGKYDDEEVCICHDGDKIFVGDLGDKNAQDKLLEARNL